MRSYRRAVSLALGAILLLDAAGIGLGVAHSLGRASPQVRHSVVRAVARPIPGSDATWQHVGPELLIHTLTADPFRPTVVYAATIEGAFRSTDAGSLWQPINAGLDARDPELWQVAPTGTRDVLIAAASDGAVYRSSDGGARWHQAGLRLDPGGVFAVVADPSHPGRAARRHKWGDLA